MTFQPLAMASEADPELNDGQLATLARFGTSELVAAGDVVYRTGEVANDLVIVESAAVEIVREATPGEDETVVFTRGPRGFLGEVNLLTGQVVYLTARVTVPGHIRRISPAQFRRVLAEDADLGELLLRALMARREVLKTNVPHMLDIIGDGRSPQTMALRTYAARMSLPHAWFDSSSPTGLALMRQADLTIAHLPAVVLPQEVIPAATPGRVAERLGLSFSASDQVIDLLVVGAGPAGLAAAVYAASEGLVTTLLDSIGPGGQAALSPRIESYLGFPHGLSGAELTGQATAQAMKFGAQLFAPCDVVGLDTAGECPTAVLSDGTRIASRAVVIASGAHYKALSIPRWREFEEAGCILYSATELEVKPYASRPVTVVGGANSAGQAALFLASRGSHVDLVIRGSSLGARMSDYLVARLRSHPLISVHTQTQVSALYGHDRLSDVTLTDNASGNSELRPSHGLFCFIGAVPATSWLTSVALDEDGFVFTDAQVVEANLGEQWSAIGRAPLPFETTVPRVFAAGDVRHGSMKRVAAVVGEGASAVSSVHSAIGFRYEGPHVG
jgi:thioredoxin reductase (NADPH)